MTITEYCAAQGCRVNAEAGTISGMTQGVAYRVTLCPFLLEMSVMVPEKAIGKLQTALTTPTLPVRVETRDSGIALMVDSSPQTGEQLIGFVSHCAKTATEIATGSYDDSFETYKEPVWAYVRGVFGALLGAIVGVLPWFLCRELLGWEFWLLGAAIGVASFFGYRYLWGAHSTRFAFTTIIVCSLVAVLLGAFVTDVFYYRRVQLDLQSGSYSEEEALLMNELGGPEKGLGDVILFCAYPSDIINTVRDNLLGIITCLIGIFGMKRLILIYTHESQHLRRNK